MSKFMMYESYLSCNITIFSLKPRFTFARIDISYARFFFLRKRGKRTIICAGKLRGF